MSLVHIKLLQRWRVDREAGMTANGPEQLVVLVLKPNEGAELAVAMSKVDAMAIGIQMQLAATDAQSG
jgi:hypothetical protein